jgi:hypothetical protein
LKSGAADPTGGPDERAELALAAQMARKPVRGIERRDMTLLAEAPTLLGMEFIESLPGPERLGRFYILTPLDA